MKVLIINVTCGVGSTGRICTDIASELEKQGHEVKIAYGRDCNDGLFSGESVRVEGKYGVLFDAFLSRVFDNAGFNSKRATERFIKWVEEYDPDIIHLHNLHGYYINVKLLFDYIKRAGKPVIWTLHDCWTFTGHCAHFDAVGCDGWLLGECGTCKHKKEYPSSAVLSRSKKNYKLKRECFCGVNNLTVVTPSEWLSNLVKKSYLKDYPVYVINNGIDTSVFKPTESSFKKDNGIDNKIMVLAVASVWTDKKGFSDFIELSKLLDDRYACVMVGVNKEQKAVLPDNIIAVERTNSIQALAEIYSSADVFVNLTYEDTYPTVNLEALACGTPVITYPTGGSMEIVKENCGFVSGKKDYKEVACIIKENFMSMKDSGMLNNVDGQCFDKMNKYSDYLELYKKIMENN